MSKNFDITSTFDEAIVYQVVLQSEAPFHTGAEDGIQTGMTYENNMCILPGTSIAGALRSWCEKMDSAACGRLFGQQENEGSIIVSNGIFTDMQPGDLSSRPRVRISRKTGSAERGGKFDVSCVSGGKEMKFALTWLGKSKGESEEKNDTALLEKMLSAINVGEIRFGGQQSNGFGIFSVKSIQKAVFDMTDENDRNAWRNSEYDSKYSEIKISSLEFKSQMVITIKGKSDMLLVKAPAVKSSGKNSSQGNIRDKEDGKYIVPGSSIKGAFRSRIEYICKVLRKDNLADEIFGCAKRGKNGDESSTDLGMAGKAVFLDAEIKDAKELEITRTSINYFTGSVMNGRLFSEKPISGNLEIKICLKEDDKVACALILLAARDLALGLFTLGSGGSIGRGYICVDKIILEKEKELAQIVVSHNPESGQQSFEMMDEEGFIRSYMKELEGR